MGLITKMATAARRTTSTYVLVLGFVSFTHSGAAAAAAAAGG